MQYLLQCSCPSASEAARYPDQVEIVFSACQHASVTVSPGGRFLDVIQKPRYIVDLGTGNKIDPPIAKGYDFLSDDLLLVDSRTLNPYLFDIRSQNRTPITIIDRWDVPTLDSGHIDPTAILPLLRKARSVYVLADVIIMLDVDSKNYMVEEFDLLGHSRDGELARPFLDENGIPYTVSYQPYHPDGWLSHTGEFLAREDGIYLVGTGEQIAENLRFPSYGYLVPAGWVYDDRGIILRPGTLYLIDLTWLPSFMEMQLVRVPQPVLMLKVPQEYLQPTPIPTP